MAYARKEIVEADVVGVYHCISRCVRRAYLCGWDAYVGKSYEHRRAWVRKRLIVLTQAFSIEVIAYAVMHNHVHTLLRIRPDIAKTLSDREVLRRWRLIFPRRKIDSTSGSKSQEHRIEDSAGNITLYRQRLSDISWFNRCLNEHIARRANAEDACTGRFWEGRFKCQRIEGIAAIVACATYIDLNPVRAGIAATPEESDYTSIQDRIREFSGHTSEHESTGHQVRLVAVSDFTREQLQIKDYLALVDDTARMKQKGKKQLFSNVAPILERLKMGIDPWIDASTLLTRQFRRIIAPEAVIRRAAAKAGRSWFHGLGPSRRLFGV